MSEIIERMADFFSGCYFKACRDNDSETPLWERFAQEVAASEDQYPILPKFHKTRGTKERNVKVVVKIPGLMRTVDVMQFLNLSEQQIRWARKKHLIPDPVRGGGAGYNLYWDEAAIKAIPKAHIARLKAGYFRGNKLFDGLPTYESILAAEMACEANV